MAKDIRGILLVQHHIVERSWRGCESPHSSGVNARLSDDDGARRPLSRRLSKPKGGRELGVSGAALRRGFELFGVDRVIDNAGVADVFFPILSTKGNKIKTKNRQQTN